MAGRAGRAPASCLARWADNVIAERWFKALKSRCLHLGEYETPREMRRIVVEFVGAYNNKEPHQSLGHATPAECHFGSMSKAA